MGMTNVASAAPARTLVETAEALSTFLTFITEKVATDHRERGYSFLLDTTFSLDFGPKFVKIVRRDGTGSRSVYGFVSHADGRIWKAASWKAPAKNFSRGNIFEPKTWNCAGVYGVA